jgi:hypothetical protein
MLYLVLVLVIAAFALLIAALTTANTVWAWVSVGISVVAAALLVFDWLRGRQRVAATSAPRQVEVEEAEPDEIEPPAEPLRNGEVEAAEPEPVSPVVDDSEPDEEPTDASDLLVVSELSAEVRVVDEHPRYHLEQCAWLAGRATLSLAVSEARQLGFTPCARCGPDAVLAAKHRAGKGATP